MSKKLFFVYNPHSGMQQIKGKLYGILQAFSDAGYEMEVYPTRERLDAVQKIISLPENTFERVVCSGGDGTLDEVVSGMMHRAEKLPIGYIPAGSTNDFAASLEIPTIMADAAKIAVTGRRFPCDIGTLNGNPFVYVAAFGIFTQVSYQTDQSLKNALGHLAYLLEGAKSLTNIKSYKAKVTSEERSFEGDFILGMITNSRSVGGFKGITGKNVVLDDGVFEVTFIRRPKTIVELNEILGALVLEEINTDYMITFKSGCVRIESDEMIPWALDGEFGGNHNDTVIRNCNRAVDIIVEGEE